MKGIDSPGKQIWRRLKRNKPAMLSLFIIIFIAFCALFCYVIMPDHTPDANRMCLPISNQPPGFETTMLSLVSNQSPSSKKFISRIFTGSPSSEDWVAVSDYHIEGKDIILHQFGSDVEEHYPHEYVKSIFQKKFLLGTDRFGRDMLSRLIAGSRITMLVGCVAVFISLLIGILLGSLAGFFRGKTDAFILWLINVTWSIPTLLLVIAITLVLGKGFSQVFIAVGLTMWVEVARLVRAQFFSLREAEFVSAAKALGFSNLRIILRHILPNISGPVLVVAASNFSASVLIESGLSFLGIGAQPPTPSWGSMIKENYGYIMIEHSAYLALLPGVAIMLVSMAFTFLANGLRDAMDSRQQISIV